MSIDIKISCKLAQPNPAWQWSRTTSSDGGDTPSEPRLDPMPSKEAANSLAAAQDNIVHHLSLHACSTLRRMSLVSFLARARASNPMKRRVSSDHLPATSPASTTSLARGLGWNNSGYVLSLRRLARTRAAPSELNNAGTTPRAKPRLPSSPVLEQAARWWPKASKGRPHLQKREGQANGDEGGAGATHGTGDSQSDCGYWKVQRRATPAPDLSKVLSEAVMGVMIRTRKSDSHGLMLPTFPRTPRPMLLGFSGWGSQSVGQCSTIRWIKSVHTCHCGFGVSGCLQIWRGRVILQCSHDHVGNFRVSVIDHAQAISPTGPMSRNTGVNCTAQTQTSHRQREGGRLFRHGIALIIVHTQNLAQTRPHALIVTFREMSHQIRPDHPQLHGKRHNATGGPTQIVNLPNWAFERSKSCSLDFTSNCVCTNSS